METDHYIVLIKDVIENSGLYSNKRVCGVDIIPADFNKGTKNNVYLVKVFLIGGPNSEYWPKTQKIHSEENEIRHFLYDEIKLYIPFDIEVQISSVSGCEGYKKLMKRKYTTDDLKESIRRIIREEIKKESPLLSLLNMLFDGFDNIEYADYFLKLVDGENYEDFSVYPYEMSEELPEVCHEPPNINDPRFDTIFLGFDETEEIKKYIGSEKNWSKEFIDIINNKFGANVKHLKIAWW